jgi:DNA invertase Pin-like site-specific DNA recombinase
MTAAKPKWAVLCVRVSTKGQTEGYSLRQQIEALREWCSQLAPGRI